MFLLSLKLPPYFDALEYEQVRWGISDPSITKFDNDNSVESQTDFPRSCLLHLTTVEISWGFKTSQIVPVIEFLLKNASKLEKMVIRVTGINSKFLFRDAEEVLRFPRLSPTAEVIFCRDDLCEAS